VLTIFDLFGTNFASKKVKIGNTNLQNICRFSVKQNWCGVQYPHTAKILLRGIL